MDNSLEDIKQEFNYYLVDTYPGYDTAFYRESKNGKQSLMQNELIDFLHHWRGIVAKGDYFYHYKEDEKKYFYDHIMPQQLSQIIREETNRMISANKMSEVTKLLMADTQVKDIIDPSEKTLLNMKNGVLNTETFELTSHDRKYFFTYQLDHNFTEDESCPEFEKMLFNLTEDLDLMQIIFEFIGYVLYGGPPVQGKALCLQGQSRTGKSTVLNVIKDLIGQGNYSAIPLENISLPFSAVALQGKIANIISETTNSPIPAHAFKTITFGEPIQVAKKFHDEFTMKPIARFIFPSNDPPVFSEVTDAIHTRLLLVPFKKKHGGNDPYFHQKFVFEYPAIIYRSLKAYHLVLERGHFTKSEKMMEVMEKYKVESDSVYEWAQEFIKFEEEAPRIGPKKLYTSYAVHCRNIGRRPLMFQSFKRRFEDNFLPDFEKKTDQKLRNICPKVARPNAARTYYHHIVIQRDSELDWEM